MQARTTADIGAKAHEYLVTHNLQYIGAEDTPIDKDGGSILSTM